MEKKWRIKNGVLLPLRSTVHHHLPDHFIAILDGVQPRGSVDLSQLPRVETYLFPEDGPSRVAPDTLSDIWTRGQNKTGRSYLSLSQEASRLGETSSGSSTIGIASINARQFRRHCPKGVKMTLCETKRSAPDFPFLDRYKAEAFQRLRGSSELGSLIRTSIANWAERVRKECWNDDNENAVEAAIGGWARHCQLERTLLATLNDCLRPDYLRVDKLKPAVQESLPLKFTQVDYVSEQGLPTDYRSISTCFETRTW